MVTSYLFYIGLALFCWLCAQWANRYEKKRYVWLIIAALTLTAGLRGTSVGIDTANYLNLFRLIHNGLFHLAYGLETSFKIIVYGIMRVVPSEQFVIALLAFITNWCIIMRCWELRKVSSFSCMVLCYYMSFYFISLNAVRQFVAVGLLFYCSRYLEKKQIWRFILGAGLATLFHRSAVIGFAMLAVNCLRWKELPRPQKMMYVMLVMAIPVLIMIALRVLARYSKYLSNPSIDIGFMLLVKLLFLTASLVLVLFMFRAYRRYGQQQELDDDVLFQFWSVSIYYLVALLLATMGYIFPMTSRISWYYYPFEGVYFGMLLKSKNKNNQVFYLLYFAFVIGYGFIYSMLNNSQGTMPYVFAW